VYLGFGLFERKWAKDLREGIPKSGEPAMGCPSGEEAFSVGSRKLNFKLVCEKFDKYNPEFAPDNFSSVIRYG
jgi:hypothetical protein